MKNTNLTFRKETKKDHRIVEILTREAFWNVHVPGCDEHYFVHLLRNADCFIDELNIVAEMDGKIVANIMYHHAKILEDDGAVEDILTFGPVSVLPKYQGRGIGSAIIEHTKAMARDMGFSAIAIYGAPKFYSRVGFEPAKKYDIATKYNTFTPALQVCELVEGALANIHGRFIEDDVCNIDADAAEEFDKGFEKKVKVGGLESQRKFAEAVKMSEERKEASHV